MLEIIAISSGKIKEECLRYLGVEPKSSTRELTILDRERKIITMRGEDAIKLLASGFISRALIGEDSFLEYQSDFENQFKVKKIQSNNPWRISLASNFNWDFSKNFQNLLGTIIATKYVNIAAEFLNRLNLECTEISAANLNYPNPKLVSLFPISGCVEGFINLSPNIRNIIDIVQSGKSLQENKLKEIFCIKENLGILDIRL